MHKMLSKNVKGDIAITTLIVAAIAITVFIVISFIFFRGTGDITEVLNVCEKQGYTCQESCGPGQVTFPYDCPDENNKPQKCCSKSLYNSS